MKAKMTAQEYLADRNALRAHYGQEPVEAEFCPLCGEQLGRDRHVWYGRKVVCLACWKAARAQGTYSVVSGGETVATGLSLVAANKEVMRIAMAHRYHLDHVASKYWTSQVLEQFGFELRIRTRVVGDVHSVREG